MAGVDMSMVPLDFSFYNLTLANVRDGSIPRTRLDDAVRRILRVKFALGQIVYVFLLILFFLSVGLFDGRTAWPNSSASSDFNRPEYFSTQRESARQVMTLLKNNENILPLDSTKITESKKLIITGPTSNSLSTLNGGWSYKDEQSYPENYKNKTIVGSFRNRLGSLKIDYYNSSSFNQLYNIDQLLNASKNASYILVCLGERAYKETEGNINDLTLDDAQLELVELIHNHTQAPIILALAQGRPRLIHRIVDLVAGIIMMYLPGMEGGEALVDVLLGDYNPSGRLPITYPKYPHLLTTYDYKWTENELGNNIDVEFEFGHGLSYTTFSYSDLKVPLTFNWNEQLNITLNVRNTGLKQGDHTILLFISDLYRSITPPNKELKAYTKISLDPNQQQQIQFTLDQHDLSFISLNLTRITEPGLFTIIVGNLQANVTLLSED